MSKTLELELGGKLDSLTEVLDKSSQLAVKASTLLPSYLKNLEELLIKTNNLVNQLNSISEKSLKVTEILLILSLFCGTIN
jgi:hypothetical protein